MKYTIVIVALILIGLVAVGCVNEQSQELEQNFGNTHHVFGLIELDGKPIDGALIEIHLNKDPSNIITTQSNNGYFTKNINQFDWKVGDMLIVRASYQTNIGYASTEIEVGMNQRVDIKLQPDIIPLMINHTLKGDIWVDGKIIKEGIVVFWLKKNENQFIMDRDLTDGQFLLNLAVLKNWTIGDIGVIQVNYKEQTFETEITVDASFDQEFDIMVVNK